MLQESHAETGELYSVVFEVDPNGEVMASLSWMSDRHDAIQTNSLLAVTNVSTNEFYLLDSIPGGLLPGVAIFYCTVSIATTIASYRMVKSLSGERSSRTFLMFITLI